MQDSDDSDRPQRRSALVARELAQLDIDIAALSEIRFTEQGSLTEEGAGYTLYWSGKSKEGRRLSGVGFTIKSSIASKLHSLPVGHSDRIMSLRLPLTINCFVSLFSMYAPTLQADAVTKEAFYRELSSLLRKVDKEDKILIMGDFNARVGRDHIIWPGVTGRHGTGNCNDNGRLLLEFYTKHSLSVTNTLFQQKARYKTTWKHLCSKHWHLLDYVLEEEFRKELEDRLKAEVSSSQEPDPEEQWQRLKTALQNSAADVAGFSTRKNRDWFDENDVEIQNLIQEKRASHARLLASKDDNTAKAAHRTVCSTLQSKLREIQNNWWLKLAEKTQLYADLGNTKAFYEALRAAYGPSLQVQAPLRSSDGTTLLTDRDSILHRWTEHYQDLFGDQRTVQDSSIDKIPQLPVKHDLDNPPLFEEVKSAIKKLKGGKAPGIDGLPAEVKDSGKSPTIAEENLPESQCGFRANRGTTDMIFVLRQLQEKCREQNMGLYAAFVDLTKAFDTVCRDGLWKVLTKLGCPPKFLAVLKQLHEDQRGQVKCGGELSEPFPIGNGVKQGCVLAPTLFAIFFGLMLREAKEYLLEGIYIRFRTDGSFFNLRRLLARTKTTEELILELLFADDCALLAHTEEALQLVVNHFADAARAFGLTISLKKTEVMYQAPLHGTYAPPKIYIDGHQLNAVEHFTYLGSIISNDATISKDVDHRHLNVVPKGGNFLQWKGLK
ncbi:uncharacterized protein LOC143281001 [Babylonia areolata]|uniref:uncharacterized protein LOC143281001 n=1 Tax=Babylonia areolata TaxID=304850 RepID=UPI003FCF6694